MVKLQDQDPQETDKSTVYVPEEAYVWEGLSKTELFPSPKSHTKAITLESNEFNFDTSNPLKLTIIWLLLEESHVKLKSQSIAKGTAWVDPPYVIGQIVFVWNCIVYIPDLG